MITTVILKQAVYDVRDNLMKEFLTASLGEDTEVFYGKSKVQHPSNYPASKYNLAQSAKSACI